MKKTIYDPRYRALTFWLKQQREEKKVTMRALAEEWGCGYSFISKYEKNQVRLDTLQYFEICMLLKIDPEEGLNILRDADHSDSK